MTMHLLGPWVTTSVYNRKRKKKISKKEELANIEHQKWIKKMGYRKTDGNFRHAFPDYGNDKSLPTSDKIPGICAGKKERLTYTGDQIIGIGTMHKSNLIPISKNSNSAKDIAKMRR